MKIVLSIITIVILLTGQALSNNVQVSNVRLTAQNSTDDFTMVEFDITWENSWRYSGGPANWDAAWIFVKYRIGPGNEWKHAWLNDTGHISCGNTTISNGFLSPSLPFHMTTNPSMGVFLYRSTNGSGTFTCQDVKLRWNYGANSVQDAAQVDIKVFAIEMVYVPQGSFYVGSGGTELGAFYTYPTTSSPYYITSEAAVTVGTQTGDLYYNNNSGNSGDQSGPIPAAYPKGFVPFYAMKYELSQKAYVDFLNTLSRAQQITRVRADITGTDPPNYFVMTNTTMPEERQGIRCRSNIPPVPGNVEFFNDLNNNGVGNENGDGLCIPITRIHIGDITSYLDWAGLRMLTEFEFEKCGRGPLFPVTNEYAWGSHMIYAELGVVNSGFPTEMPSESVANVAYNSSPMRCGAFARPESNRENAGAGYYGCMELSGNAWETMVSVGSSLGRNYTGNHGNGLIDSNGNSNVANWPVPTLPYGVCYRGGSTAFLSLHWIRLSHREAGAFDDYLVDNGISIRGARTAQ